MVLWQEIAEYILPTRATVTVRRAPGAELTQELMDSTGNQALARLAATMAGSLTSPAMRWFSLKLRQQARGEDKVITDWLGQVEEAIYLGLRQSNFNAEAAECYLDLAAFGTGCLWAGERQREVPGFNGFVFRALPIGTYVIAENPEGDVDTLIRRFELSAAAAAEQFGPERLPEPIQRALQQGRPDERFPILHAVYPRRVEDPRRRDRLHLPWASVYVDERTRTVLLEDGEPEFPYMVPRWAKIAGDVWGFGPGHIALPDLRTLNRATELLLQAASKVIDPPGLVSSDATVAELDLRPGSQNVVDGDPRQAWVPLESGAKFDVSTLLREDLRRQIREAFYWDQLQPLGTDRVMTATEIERRMELMRRILGPTLGRFEHEFLSRLLNRCFGLMYRARALPEPPAEIRGQEIDVEYEGPLVRSQKAVRLAAWEQILAHIQALGAISPAAAQLALDNFDLDAAVRDLAAVAGLPSAYLEDADTVAERRAERQAQQEQAAQLEAGARLAEAAGRAAPAAQALARLAPLGRGAA